MRMAPDFPIEFLQQFFSFASSMGSAMQDDDTTPTLNMPGRFIRMASRCPSDNFLFPKLKEHLSGTMFSSDSDVKKADWLRKARTISMDRDPIHHPQPFKFGYSVKDKHGEQHREEVGDGKNVKGSYGFTDARGVHRQVNYVADHAGFRAQVKTNEPGTANQNPAAVHMISDAPYGHGGYAGAIGLGYAGDGGAGYGYGGLGTAGLGYGYGGLGTAGVGYGNAGLEGYGGLGYGGNGLLGGLGYARYGY
ncbi:hypothetical protein AVEN_221672-1 [Araneus ventricosus]|uniref:Cuticle protein 16.8 n=1 Tax=Araneus ventricosus TaxID=182803 RepID=A0A4Y2UXD5_ARAVE|nr:hypothetical protein AVEN_221672-1 [Araneus ventricosus]